MILVNDVSCRIAARLTLRVDHLQIAPGQHWCIFGANGAGTSLLAALIAGRLTAAGDKVCYSPDFNPRTDIIEVSFEEQRRVWELDQRRDISDFEPTATDIGTTVGQLVRGAQTADTDEALMTLLTDLGIATLVDRGIRYLSSGQMRRVMLARALFQQPRLLILDNPLESIDRQSAQRINDTLARWMSGDNVVLQLARRQKGILTGLTHMALMQETAFESDERRVRDLSLVAAGPLPEVTGSAHFHSLTRTVTNFSMTLPEPCAGREPPPIDREIPLIELGGVTLAYGERVLLENFHWTMKAGDHVLIEGPNGSGKSTLLAMISGDNHKAYGQPVRLFGRQRGSGESVWQVKARFGVVSNDLHQRYIKGWRVLDVVVSGFFDSLGLYDDSGASEHACALEWLNVLQLDKVVKTWYHELSFGQQRLVLLARAMVKHPAVLILDEPCTGLDDYHCSLLLALLDQIAGSGRTNILFVSHTEGDVPSCINRFLRLDGEGGVETGTCLPSD